MKTQGANYSFRQHFGSTRIHMHVIVEYAHNVGQACAVAALAEGNTDAAQLLDNILRWPVISEAVTGGARLECQAPPTYRNP